MAENMISVEDAQEIILAHVRQTPCEEVPLAEACGRPLADGVVSDIDLAPFAHSAMDGFAVRAADLAEASADTPVELDVVGHEAAGAVFAQEVRPGQALRIMTGAPVPAGADAVVKYEVVGVVAGDGSDGSRVSFTAPAQVGENIRAAGLEAKAGAEVLKAGEVLTAAGCGLAASAGAERVVVRRRPHVGVISLGSELVAPGAVPERGMIRDANSSALMAAALEAGAQPRFVGMAPDDPDKIRALILKAAETCDFVVTSGGASAGDYDYVTALAAEEGEVFFDRVAMRPGKSQTFGLVRGVPFVGLAGNPAAASVGFEILVRPALRQMMGFTELARPVQTARLATDQRKKQPRRYYLRGRVERNEAGELVATPAKSQNSGLFGTLHHANCLVVIPEDAPGAHAGDAVACVRIDLPEGSVL